MVKVMNERWQQMYRNKLRSADEAVELLRDGDAVLVPLANGQPRAIGDAIGRRLRAGGVRDLHWIGGVDVLWMDCFDPELQDLITIDTGFVSAATRYGVQQGWYTFSPNRLGQSIDIVRDHKPGINRGAVACVVSPMDEHGFFSTGCHADLPWGAIGTGEFREVILEVNENMPRTFGNNHIHISEVSAIVENNVPLFELPEIPICKEDQLIAGYVLEHIQDGACLQIGIGGMPNAIAKNLRGKKDLGIHSEMLTDSMVDLYYEGVVTCHRKNFNRNKIIGAFALGTKKLYDFVHNNPMVEMHCTSYVNDPYVIGQNDNMISVNGTVEVDLSGQAASESLGYVQYSGTGGQLDFIQGAWRSNGGKSFLALYATYTKDGKLHSKIKPTLTPGMFVTASRSEVDYIVTEFGIAKMKGNSMRVRVQNLVNIAHPDFRDWLMFEARKMNFTR
ncbi:MAG: acetyl-CoA hydrolase/transferase family protein [Candidatus Saccharibacteria bacterium]